jgi:F-type H+-transporting ATPase subunit alpha
LGVLHAVDIGKSVSRVGGKAQRAAYRALAGNLKLGYAQFEELEIFSWFGARLDEDTLQNYRTRTANSRLPQTAGPVPAQIAVLLALTAELFDRVPLDRMPDAEDALPALAADIPAKVCERLDNAENLSDEDRETIIQIADQSLARFQPKPEPESESESGQEDQTEVKPKPEPEEKS